jgi:repressor LexA
VTAIATIPTTERQRPHMSAELIDLADPRTFQVLAAIEDHLAERGYPPTVRQIGQRVGLSSTSAVINQLRKLERLGLIVRDGNDARAIRLVEAAA